MKIDELVRVYIEKRDALNAARQQWQEFEAQTKEDMERIEVQILTLAQELGVKNFKTKYGTAFRKEKDYARVAGPEGWDKLVGTMIRLNDFGLVEKRVAKTHFKEVMKHEGIAPQDMGVEYIIEETIGITRNSSRESNE